MRFEIHLESEKRAAFLFPLMLAPVKLGVKTISKGGCDGTIIYALGISHPVCIVRERY